MELASESFSPTEEAAISQAMSRAESFRNAMATSQVLIDISVQFKKMNLGEIDRLLRSKGSQTFFVAKPVSDLPDFKARWPHSADKEYPYYLWICVNGPEEYADELAREELSSDENKSRLGETGLLVAEKNSTSSRILHSANN
jgi:hypothetical protein